MNIDEWEETVKQWMKLYPPKKSKRREADPTKVRRGCTVCSSPMKLTRHHKGNDFMFARLRPDLFAARYVQFRPEDIDNICDNCHHSYHRYERSTKLKDEFWYDWNHFIYYRRPKDSEIKEFLEAYRRRFIKLYKNWKKKERKKHHA